MTSLFVYDDAKARTFEPFALTRPVSELRAGAEVIRARWESVTGLTSTGFLGAPHLQSFDEAGASSSAGDCTMTAGSLVVNSRCVVTMGETIGENESTFTCDGAVCAVRLSSSIESTRFADGSLSLDSISDGARVTDLGGSWLDEVWDLVGNLDVQLMSDLPAMGRQLECVELENATVMGKHGIFCEVGAVVEHFVVLDATAGPIVIRRGATISSFSRIVGPCYIGQDSTIVADAIRGCSIGDVCKVRGEMSGSVMLGYSNKGHTGFVGSSYLGRWVNLGSGTTTSNLKNTYGSVQLATKAGLRDTGLQFLGSLVGDHAKTGIGTMLTTGCVVGAGANIFGSAPSPKSIPPFAWGAADPYDRYDLTKFIEVAERMMARRHVSISDKTRAQLEDSFKASAAVR